jgi:transposase
MSVLEERAPARATVATTPIPQTPARATAAAEPTEHPPAQALDLIRSLGQLLDDLEQLRIANGNRIGALERERGGSLPHLELIQGSLEAIEHEAQLELRRAWRRHPLSAWAKSIPGAGETLMARLVAAVGDPASRPNPGKLWAYCGHGDPERSRIPKGATQAELFRRGNSNAKKRVYLLAAQFRRTPGSPYRLLYDQARDRYAERVHERACPRCGPAGKPAQPGSPWSLGHQDAAALRFVGKRFLLDLWLAARELEEEC